MARITFLFALLSLMIYMGVVSAGSRTKLYVSEAQASVLANQIISNVEEVILVAARNFASEDEMTKCYIDQKRGFVKMLSLKMEDTSELTDYQKSLISKLKRGQSDYISESDSRYYYALKALNSGGESCIRCHDRETTFRIQPFDAHGAVFVTIPIHLGK